MRAFIETHPDWLTKARLLKTIQYRPGLINGFLAQIGLTLEPEPP
jgi:hypothetical protein